MTEEEAVDFVEARIWANGRPCPHCGGYGVESMDVTLHSDDGDGKSKYEDERFQRTLADHDDSFIEGAMFGKRYARDRTIDDIENEELATGVPAAFWMRSERID